RNSSQITEMKKQGTTINAGKNPEMSGSLTLLSRLWKRFDNKQEGAPQHRSSQKADFRRIDISLLVFGYTFNENTRCFTSRNFGTTYNNNELIGDSIIDVSLLNHYLNKFPSSCPDVVKAMCKEGVTNDFLGILALHFKLNGDIKRDNDLTWRINNLADYMIDNARGKHLECMFWKL
ncbi:hypothetical protein BGZ83_005051, partial [Gryganskiella cystojenkinii]